MLTITEGVQDGATVLNLSGRMEFSERKTFMNSVNKVQEEPLTHLILNLQGVSFVDSAALGLLALTQQNLKLKHARVSIANPQEYVRKVLDLANFSKFMPLFPSVQEAARSPVLA